MKTEYIFSRVRRLFALVIGFVFLYAGIFKILDPVGSGLVMESYFKFLHLGFLLPIAKESALMMALLESFLGAALIAGVWRKIVAIATSSLIVIFTVLTLFLAIFNPINDCGCFGEVVHLTNVQTFIKNVILLLLAIVSFVPLKTIGDNKPRKFYSFAIVAVALVAFSVFSWNSIPLIDYTAFKPGSELASFENEETAIDGEYGSTFVYSKDGKEKTFTLEDLPDSTWTFERTETVKEADTEDAPILSFSDSTGTYCDNLALTGNVLVYSVYDPDSMTEERWAKISENIDSTSKAGYLPLLLVASSEGAYPGPKNNLYFADRKTLVSINRSNGGATWFSDGELIQKYPFRNLPSAQRLCENLENNPTEQMLKVSAKKHRLYQEYLLFIGAILLFI